MKILDHYISLIESTDGVINDAMQICRNNKEKTPILIDNKPVTIPTKELLDKNDWDDIHPFHPLCEDALMGQSPTFHLLYSMIRLSLSKRYAALILDILKVATTKELQQQVKDPGVNDLLKVYPEVKSGALKSWKTVYATFAKNQYFAGITITRSQNIDGQHYLRVGTLTCPIMEDDSTKTLLGADIANKDVEGLRAIVTAIMKPVPTQYFSNATVPYYDTLLQFYKAMAERYNELLGMFGDVISSEPIPLDWTTGYKSYESIRKTIPRLPGNAGVRIDKEAERTTGADEDDVFEDAYPRVPTTRSEPEDKAPWKEDEPSERRGERVQERDVRPPRREERERPSVEGMFSNSRSDRDRSRSHGLRDVLGRDSGRDYDRNERRPRPRSRDRDRGRPRSGGVSFANPRR